MKEEAFLKLKFDTDNGEKTKSLIENIKGDILRDLLIKMSINTENLMK